LHVKLSSTWSCSFSVFFCFLVLQRWDVTKRTIMHVDRLFITTGWS